jgi:hypothetical protein
VVSRSIQQNNEKKLNHQHFAKFPSRGASELFLSKTSLSNDLLTVPTVFTSTSLIDSAKQEEQTWIIKILQNSNQREPESNFYENSPFE